MSRWTSAVIVLCCLLAVGTTAFSQTTGNIRGTVSDETAAILPGATVTLYSDAIIGGSRTLVTNEVGVYRFPSLPVGTYAVEVEMDGFDIYRVEDIAVQIGATATVNVSMKLGTLAETITVTGESPVVDVTEPGVSTSFKEEMVRELPTTRNFYDFIQMAPGMSAVYSGGIGDRTVAFGSNQQSNSWNIGRIALSRRDLDQAEKHLEIAIESRAQRLFLAWHLLGRVRFLKEDYDGARQAFREAVT